MHKGPTPLGRPSPPLLTVPCCAGLPCSRDKNSRTQQTLPGHLPRVLHIADHNIHPARNHCLAPVSQPGSGPTNHPPKAVILLQPEPSPHVPPALLAHLCPSALRSARLASK